MASESNEIITALRIIGAGEYSRAAHYASQSVREIDNAQTRAERSARSLGQRMDLLSGQIGRGLGRGATVAATFGAGLVKMGLNFDAMIERSEIGIGSLVGSMDQAKDITADVRDFALKAPLFGTDQMIKTAQQLIGAGYDAKNVVPYLTTFSDTLSALGRRPEDLQRMTYAFVQMMSKGQISAEELRGQLGEIFPAQKILAREMGLSTDEFARKMKEGTFKGSKYIHLLLRGMEKDFGGSTERMATTFDGQLANIRESTKYTLGILFKPLFTYLEKDAFPALKYFGDETVATMEDASLTSDQKFKKIKESATFWLGSIWDDFKAELGKVNWGDQVSKLSNTLGPLMGTAFSTIGKSVAKALWDGFWQSNYWGKAFIATILISKLGLWGPIFGALGKKFGKRMGRQVALETAAGATTGEGAAALGAAGTKSGSLFGRAMGAASRIAFMAAVVKMSYDANQWLVKQPWYKRAIDKIDKKVKGGGKVETFLKGITPGNPKQTVESIAKSFSDMFHLLNDPISKRHRRPPGHRQHGGPVSAGNPYVVGERGPELFMPNMSGSIKPSLGGMTLHNYVMLDGRVTAQSVAKHNFSEMARK
jgi:tape measure domain-containing protein